MHLVQIRGRIARGGFKRIGARLVAEADARERIENKEILRSIRRRVR
jgi:hypothetical protein